MQQSWAPIILFVYRRPVHTRKTLEELSKNDLADQSVLYIYSDGPKINPSKSDISNINEIRKLIREKKWCAEVNIIEREENMGLADSIISGVNEVIEKHGKAIVMEDDIITSRYFLKFMNEALVKYENNEKVMHITGHSFPLSKIKQDTYFLKYVSPWGWATWKNRWSFFEKDTSTLLKRLNDLSGFDLEDYNSGYGNAFYEQLLANQQNSLNTWAVKWHTTIYLHDGLCLFPKNSLVFNSGFDASGENCTDQQPFFSDISNSITEMADIQVKINEIALASFKKYYKDNVLGAGKNQFIKKIYGRLQSVFMGKR